MAAVVRFWTGAGEDGAGVAGVDRGEGEDAPPDGPVVEGPVPVVPAPPLCALPVRALPEVVLPEVVLPGLVVGGLALRETVWGPLAAADGDVPAPGARSPPGGVARGVSGPGVGGPILLERTGAPATDGPAAAAPRTGAPRPPARPGGACAAARWTGAWPDGDCTARSGAMGR
ncbi:hypothetical protein [Streptomyces sp. NBC_00388]|uniref:hypothetical protein n=1 Tax=Streptomyces sp. NBC_00388 TaxID=2975735 RepID=UPI002E20BF9E